MLERVNAMAVRKLGRLPIGALALIALLGGCSNGSVSSLPAASGSMARAELSPALHKNKTGGGVVYLTQMYGNDVSVYQRQGQSGLNLGFLKNVHGTLRTAGRDDDAERLALRRQRRRQQRPNLPSEEDEAESPRLRRLPTTTSCRSTSP